ncbi:dephospho-CoA kinase [Corynebacterium yudongzhengii]|uniref:Dephospho-CoA kinase n=1 Tax=Corynebacterium yudongzhengii TaxID=2080740 RepID=A0A2U1T625_9CORY|nr:dephospho-CoA kinase [Corynebacterium yudongzhengii]AWB81995.1 dephospho-CoA kinase [Corynebacterium yudongzhengii]PWC01457.1 dephospho-CoA kinase [Corynebacterium yudongzhengii]
MRIIGLTGGIGSGKSTAATMLAEAGFPVIDADKLAREVVEPGMPALRELAEAFGEDILDGKGALRRSLLAERAFSSKENTERLNAITHPAIRRLQQQRIQEAADAGAHTVIYDMPLLIEQGLDEEMDLTVVVHTDRQLRIERLESARGISPQDAARRMDAQVDDETRLSKADVVLDNSGTLEELAQQVDRLVDKLKKS